MVLQVRLKKPRARPLRKAVKRSPKEGAKVVEYEEQPPTRAGQNDNVQAQKFMVEDASIDPTENTAFQNEGTNLESRPKSRKSGALVLLMFCFGVVGASLSIDMHLQKQENTMSAF